ncbi:unnamed protein product [Brachionus calyciflorus]|uniref:ABC transporter TMD0 domain-containing protein n=1 Tax=Brachionus calyciflorus TaxID=104777 RepID=A0A814HXA7_9BILA|nr:unnamed protein product [Brachionus calyciflorus]
MLTKHIEYLCGAKLWDNETVYSDHPEFTQCFQMTFLIWGPCLILWVVAPLWFYMLTRQKTNILKISWLFIVKNISIFGLICVEIFRLVVALMNSKDPIYILTPAFLIMTYILAIAITHFEKIRGLRSSTLMFIFWCLLTFANLITARSKFLSFYFKSNNNDHNDTLAFILFYVLVWINLIFSLFSEKVKVPVSETGEKLKVLPENYVSLLSRLSFWWINDLILTGYKRDLTKDDLWSVDETEASENVTKKFETAWNKASEK